MSLGEIHVELNEAEAPITVENFLGYVDDGFYDETIFHRVIPGFMIQCGGFTADMSEKPTKDTIKNEA
ncbi:MAG: peptidylprolyl isomerase, partial [Gemmatimonadetes bacterium]|nr:peptidylprolyl isomerase [Gemmatimonadota bacterium]